MRCLAFLLLFVSSTVWAATPNPLRICSLGDIQHITWCLNDTTAWDHGEAAVQWIVDNPGMCDVVLFPGDVVVEHGPDRCWCATQNPPVCEELQNPETGNYCLAIWCNDPEAIVCDGGTAGGYCEYTRVVTLLDMLRAADIPFIVTAGNHDSDSGEIWQHCDDEFTIYNSYFGKGNLSDDFVASEIFEHEVSCSLVADGVSEQADSSWHVLTAAGTQWLFINVAWPSLDIDEAAYVGMTAETLAWLKQTIRDHVGMPMFIVTHFAVSRWCGGTGFPAEWATELEDAWCGRNLAWWKYFTGTTIYREILMDADLSKTLVAVIGGHIRDNAYTITANTPHAIPGIAFDYTDPLGGSFPAWQSVANGGGGIVQIMKIDGQANTISTKGYSPYEDEWVGVFGDEPSSHYELSVPMCSDDVRYNFPAATCPEREPSPECCRK